MKAALVVLLLAVPALGLAAVPTPGAVAWDILPPLPVPRTEVAAAAIGDRIYVLGGLGAGVGGGRQVDVYDAATGRWGRGPDLPEMLHHTQVVAVGPRLFVLGGYTGTSFSPTASTWMLDTTLPAELQLWLPWAALPLARGAHAAATDGNDVWVFGGVGPSGLERTALRMPGVEGVPLPLWLPIADFPDPRDHLTGAYLDGKVYAVGGRDLSLASNTGRLDAFDPAVDSWTRGPDMPTPRGGIASAAVAGELYVYGGEANSGTFDAAEAFDPAAGTWSQVAPMPHARHGLGAASRGEDVHVIAGGPIPGLTVSGFHERMRVLP